MPPPALLPLWPLAVLAALLPTAGSLLALQLSMGSGAIPACNPFLEGCVSVSRAARQDIALPWFRAIALPGAVLQGLVWLLVARWLAARHGPSRTLSWLAGLGVVACVALVLYGSFLGLEGAVQRALRQYGTVAYFGVTCINQLLLARALQGRGGPEATLLKTLAITLVLLGVVNAIVAAFFGDALKARTENVTEWWGSLLLVAGFLVLARLWWREDVRIAVGAQGPSRSGP